MHKILDILILLELSLLFLWILKYLWFELHWWLFDEGKNYTSFHIGTFIIPVEEEKDELPNT